MSGINATEMLVFLLLFVFVAVMGFMAARWKSGDTMDHLDEWGLGGRKFGGWITWFPVGGDLYTAYTFVAVPALMYASGAIGFFALPYTVVLYPIVFLPVLRLWSVSRSDGYVTPADFVRGRYSSPTLALIVAITGIVATMPYIALQLIGGVIILQTLPAVAIALYTRWLHSKALIAGWVVGMAWALYLLWTIPNPAIGKEYFGGSALTLSQLSIVGWHPFAGSTVQIYVGVVALAANLLVAVLVTIALRLAKVGDGRDATQGADYHADEGDPALRPIAVH